MVCQNQFTAVPQIKYNHFLFTSFKNEPLSAADMHVSHITECLYVVSFQWKFMPQKVK